MTNNEQLTSSRQRNDKDIGMAERLQEKSHSRFFTNYTQTAESINLEKTKTMTFSNCGVLAPMISSEIILGYATALPSLIVYFL